MLIAQLWQNARYPIQMIKDGQCCVSLLCGATVSENKMQKVVAETLTINREQIRSGIKHCTSEGCTAAKRKRHNDATPKNIWNLCATFGLALKHRMQKGLRTVPVPI